MEKKVSEHVTWVGKVDWELKRFHGDELSTNRGSSYNAYLIRDRKTVLVDTVWGPYDKEFVERLSEEIDLASIDAVVMNHSEVDHSGALRELMRRIPGTPIYCTAKGKEILQGYWHEDWNFVTVKTGDELELGQTTLTFIEAPMLHWPDTMFSYLSGDGVLFSTDGFGQHYAAEGLFSDTVDKGELMYEAEKYFVNILHPYAQNVARKLKELEAMTLPIAVIAPSHGVLWRDEPKEILEKYRAWAEGKPENRITILYDSMWGSTRAMAEAIAEGIGSADPTVTVKLMNAVKDDKNDILTEIFRSNAVLVGSPTVNYGCTYAIAGMLEMMRGLRFRNKKAAAFGSYGWSGDAPGQITEHLRESGFEMVNEGIRVKWAPDGEARSACREYGKAFAEAVGDKKNEEEPTPEPPKGKKYACSVCGYEYDPAVGDPTRGIPAGTPFEELPDDWRCPICRMPKERFKEKEL